MEPYASRPVAEAASQCGQCPVLAANHFADFHAAPRRYFGCHAIEAYSGVVDGIHGLGLLSALLCIGLVLWLFGRLYSCDGSLQPGDGLIAADEFGCIEHVWAFAFSDDCQPECVHHVAHMVAMVGNPS